MLRGPAQGEQFGHTEIKIYVLMEPYYGLPDHVIVSQNIVFICCQLYKQKISALPYVVCVQLRPRTHILYVLHI